MIRIPKDYQAYAKGIFSFLPLSDSIIQLRGTRKNRPASYYYGIWLKHLTLAWEAGLRKMPDTVVEFGPGDSFGAGIAAVLSGANRYYGLDVVDFSSSELNLAIFEEMIHLFKTRSPRPEKGWPDYDQFLGPDLFPSHIVTDDILKNSLKEERLDQIRKALQDPSASNTIGFSYIVPWSTNNSIPDSSIDFCFSHSVLQYVEDLDDLFHKINNFLKPEGMMSHQIDLSAHNLSNKWNGHREFSEWQWRILQGRRPYFLNRFPYSQYIQKIQANHFQTHSIYRKKENTSEDITYASRWKNLSREDRETSGTFVLASISSQDPSIRR